MRRRTPGYGDRFAVAPGVTVEQHDADVTFFQARTGTYWRGNETAAAVVARLRAGRTVGEVVDELAARCGDERDVVGRDAAEVVGSLVAARILAPREGTA